jgi:hypothetical protein
MGTLYTESELIAKIKKIDEQLESAVTVSDLDTGQSKHSFRTSVDAMRKQRETYLALLQTNFPEIYREYFGFSVINFGGRSCR